MAYEIPGFVFSEQADDAAVDQFMAVQLGATGLVICNATERCIGIVQQPIILNLNETVRVMKSGISFAVAGVGDVTRGSEVEVGAGNGVLMDQVGGVAIGVALQDAVAGERFSVLLY